MRIFILDYPSKCDAERAGVPPSFIRGVFDATVGRCIFTQLLLSVTAGARAHTVALHCVWTNTEVTWARRQRRARWHRSGYTGSSAPVHHYNRRSERSRAKPKTEKCDRRWRVSSNASARCPSALTLMRSIFVPWNTRLTPCVLGRHREAPRLGCVGVAMADRDSLPLPLEVRARFAELELELSEGE